MGLFDSKAFKIGSAIFTGGAAAGGMAAAGGTPLGNAISAGAKIGGMMGSSAPKKDDKSFQSQDPSQSTLGNDYSMGQSDPNDPMGAMKRRKSMIGGGY